MPNGEVLGCQIVYDAKHSEGNVRDRPLSSIWRHGFRTFRQPRFDRECLDCEHLPSCRGGCWGMRLNSEAVSAKDRPHHCLKRIWGDGAGAG
jgi:radical SAM protein with 4Fe4S-binding SPASM domain